MRPARRRPWYASVSDTYGAGAEAMTQGHRRRGQRCASASSRKSACRPATPLGRVDNAEIVARRRHAVRGIGRPLSPGSSRRNEAREPRGNEIAGEKLASCKPNILRIVAWQSRLQLQNKNVAISSWRRHERLKAAQAHAEMESRRHPARVKESDTRIVSER